MPAADGAEDLHATRRATALHNDPVVSFAPSTLVHQTPTGAIVQVQVTCGSGGSQFGIVDLQAPDWTLIDWLISAQDVSERSCTDVPAPH